MKIGNFLNPFTFWLPIGLVVEIWFSFLKVFQIKQIKANFLQEYFVFVHFSNKKNVSICQNQNTNHDYIIL